MAFPYGLILRHLEEEYRLRFHQDPELVGNIEHAGMFWMAVHSDEIDAESLESAQPRFHVFPCALDIAEVMASMSAHEQLMSVQVEMRSFPCDLAETEPDGLAVQRMAFFVVEHGHQVVQVGGMGEPEDGILPGSLACAGDR